MSSLRDSNLSLGFQWTRMAGLVNSDLPPSGKFTLGKLSPTLFAHIGDLHPPRLEFRQGRRDVIAHEEKLVLIVFLGIMKRSFEWRHGKYQPAMAAIH